MLEGPRALRHKGFVGSGVFGLLHHDGPKEAPQTQGQAQESHGRAVQYRVRGAVFRVESSGSGEPRSAASSKSPRKQF